jgi:hypothetical protein
VTRSGEPRFIVRGQDGREDRVPSVEVLQERVAAGKVLPEDEIYDAGTGRWSPARDVPVYRFIVEELASEGTLPPGLDEVLDTGAEPGSPAGERQEAPAPEPERVELEDPLEFEMDLADPDLDLSGPMDPEPGDDILESGDDGGAEVDKGLDDLDDFSFQPGSSALEEWADVPRSDPSATQAEQPDPPPRHEPPDSSDPDPEERWFTPHEEGGMVIADPPARPGAVPGDGKAEVWSPDEEEAPPRRRFSPSRKVPPAAVWVVGAAVIAGGLVGWLLLRTPGADLPTDGEITLGSQVPAPMAPSPLPVGLEEAGEAVAETVAEAFAAASDSLRMAMGLEGSPPRDWLSGMYLANAGSYPVVEDFWRGYGEFVSAFRPRDREIFERGMQAGLDALPELSAGDRSRLRAYFRDRYESRAEFREYRYESLLATSRAALALHQVLERHQAEIAFSPAIGPGVSADPILEAVIPEGEVQRDVERALDQVFRALDHSRGGGVPSAGGLRSELFLRFGEI